MTPQEMFKALDTAGIDFDVVEVFEGVRLIRVMVDDFEPTDEQKAFIDAYLTCVASASEEECIAFFAEDAPNDGDAFSDKWSTGTYSTIMDAWCVWQRATDYAKHNK
jgi:hypothetical protein